MINNAKFAHVNLVAEDWRRLAEFYTDVFGCTPLPPERDFSGDDLDRGTGVPGARLTGMHLLLPGCGDNVPTLEIFHYSVFAESNGKVVNRPGFGHIAFVVDDVEAASNEVLRHGGSAVGEIVTMKVETGPKVTWCYVRDPEGNIIELQSWVD